MAECIGKRFGSRAVVFGLIWSSGRPLYPEANCGGLNWDWPCYVARPACWLTNRTGAFLPMTGKH